MIFNEPKEITLERKHHPNKEKAANYWILKINGILKNGSWKVVMTFEYKSRVKRTFWDWVFFRKPTETRRFVTSNLIGMIPLQKDDTVHGRKVKNPVMRIRVTESDSKRYMRNAPVSDDGSRIFVERFADREVMHHYISLEYSQIVSIRFTEATVTVSACPN